MSDEVTPMYPTLFSQVQDYVVERLNSDYQLSAVGLEFIPEHIRDVEYLIKRNLGKQGMVGIVNTVKAQYGGHDGETQAWQMEVECDILENPPVRQAWMKKNDISAGTVVDCCNFVNESLAGPYSPTYGQFCSKSVEVGEDSGIVVGKCLFDTYALGEISGAISGESHYVIKWATKDELSALSAETWNAIYDLSAELSGSEEVWNAISELSSEVSSLYDEIQEIDQDLSDKISYPVMGQNPYGSNEWVLEPSPLDPDTPSTAKVKFGAYEESVPGLYTPYIKLGDNPDITIDQNHIWLGRTKLVNFPDMSAAISALDIDHFIRWFATPSQPNRWIVNFGRSSTGGISFVSDSDHPTQSYIDIAGNLITAPGYDPELSSRGSDQQTTRGLMKARAVEDDHLMFNQKGLAFVEELSAVEADLEPRLSAIESEVSALSAQTIERFSQIDNDISALSAWDTTQDSLISELSTQTISNSTDLSALGVEIQEVSANMSKSIIRRWEPVAGLRFVAEEANSTVAMAAAGSAPSVSLEYNTGDGWNDFIVGETTVTLANVGDECFIRAKTTNTGMASSASDYNKFVMTGKIAASDSIMYLLKNDGDLSAIPSSQCFNQLFYDCSSLVTAPTLPATTLADYCYQNLFNNCTSLTKAPELPATTLASSCYRGMFYNCIALTSAPELSADTLAYSCYALMFYGCTSLTQAPILTATTLATICYSAMFYGCTSLTAAPELPATTLTQGCYSDMFRGCTSLTTAPELPATTLASGCYQQMFYGCTSLSEIKIAYTGNFSGTGVPSMAFYNWVYKVASSGTFYYDGEDTTTGNSAIPTGWDVQPLTPSQMGLSFIAEEANSTIAMQAIGDAPSVSLEYTTDGSTWQDFIVGETTVTLPNIDDEVQIRAKTTNARFATGTGGYNQFVMTGKIAASGSIMYLLDKDGDSNATLTDHCFVFLFKDQSSLTSSPEFPALTLAPYCYQLMFNWCEGLVKAADILPAMTLAEGCYWDMYSGCTSLTKAPELPATTLVPYCYQYMFNVDYALSEIKIGYTGNLYDSDAFGDWVNSVSAAGTFYYNGSDTTRGTSAIPNGWTIQSF